MKDQKLTPRLAGTAKALWGIYLGLTVSCALAYWVAGMTLFDAIGHAFSTIAIGGFSTHDASMGHYADQPLIAVVAIVFMLIAGINFTLHFVALPRIRPSTERVYRRDAGEERARSVRRRRGERTVRVFGRRFNLIPGQPRVYISDPECGGYLIYIAVVALATIVYLHLTQTLEGYDALLHGVFQAVSIATTTGFTTAEYFSWPGFLAVLLLFTSFIGCCAGSTGGGMKVVRCLLLYKQGAREITQLIHPNALVPVKLGNDPVSERVISAVWGFFALYIASFGVMMLLLMAFGLDQVTAFSAVAACINNLGPGLGEVGANFASIDPWSKLVLCVAMLLGRLEVFTLLVLLSRDFWFR